MDDKPIWNSQTIQGIAGLLVVVMGLLGYQVASMDVVNLINLAMVAGTSLIAVASAVHAFIGRIKANQNLKLGSRKLEVK